MLYSVNEHQLGFSGVNPSLVASSLGKTFTTEENSIIQSYIDMVESLIINQTDRQFKVLSNDDYYYQDGILTSDVITFKSYPVSVLKAIYLNDELVYDKDSSSNKYRLNFDFTFDRYNINLTNYLYQIYQNESYKVVFNILKFYGDDIKLAVLTAVQEMFLNRDYGQIDIRNISLAGFSYSIGQRFDLLNKVIQKYIKLNI